MLTSSSCHPHSDTQHFQEQSCHLLGTETMGLSQVGMLVKIPLRVLGSPELSTSPFVDVTWSLGPHIHIQIAGILDTKKGKTYNLLKFVDMYIHTYTQYQHGLVVLGWWYGKQTNN